jgi:2,3-bisphosphoglycerate-independent phosphoglycerate mutase
MTRAGGSGTDLLVVLDGLAEPPARETTLATARTPFLDALVRLGHLCRIDPQAGAGAGEISSERGIARLLGLSAEETLHLSRASLLSLLSAAIDFSGWVYLGTPVCFGPDGALLRYVNRQEDEEAFWTAVMARATEGEPFRFLPVSGRGGGIDRMVVACPGRTGTTGTPPRQGLGLSWNVSFPEFSQWIGRAFPGGFNPTGDPGREINGVWLWGGGPAPEGAFREEGREDWLVVGATSLVRALGLRTGFRPAPLLRATGDTDTDLPEKMARVEEGLRGSCSRILLHIEGADMASHRRDPEEKRVFLERMDREVFSRLLQWFGEGRLTSLSVTSDHQSSPVTGNHEAGPVPALFLSRNYPRRESPTPGRMTEWEVRTSPVVCLEKWLQWPSAPPGEDGAGYSGKDLCLAL